MLRCDELPSEILALLADCIYLVPRGGLLTLGGEPVPGLLPPAVTLKIDAACVHEGEQERLPGELPPEQDVTDGGTGEPGPLQPGAGQKPVCVGGLLLKRPEGRLVGEEMDMSEADCQVLKAGRCGRVRVIHGLACI